MTLLDARSQMLRRLSRIAERLPTGLLHRLVDDAQFFHDWNMKKKQARASSRLRSSKSTAADESTKKRQSQKCQATDEQ